MEIVLSRKGGVPVRDQIKTQIELKILNGEFPSGQRLPSVRALARRLKVHANTVSAAYQDLEAAGHLELRSGSGVFVRGAGPKAPQEARELDEMIRLGLQLAFDKGYSGDQIRAAVRRWLAAAPPDRVVVVDPVRELGELVGEEIRLALGLPAAWCSIEEVAERPERLSGALAVALPYHLESLRRLLPSAAVEGVNLEIAQEDRRVLATAPAGTIVLVVSHSPTVLPFATVFGKSLRGDELLVEARLLSQPAEWGRLVRAADLVFADVLALEAVRRARPRKLRELRLVPKAALARLRDTLTIVVPRG